MTLLLQLTALRIQQEIKDDEVWSRILEPGSKSFYLSSGITVKWVSVMKAVRIKLSQISFLCRGNALIVVRVENCDSGLHWNKAQGCSQTDECNICNSKSRFCVCGATVETTRAASHACVYFTWTLCVSLIKATRQAHRTANHFRTIKARPQSHLASWKNKIINVVWTSEQQLFMTHQRCPRAAVSSTDCQGRSFLAAPSEWLTHDQAVEADVSPTWGFVLC